MNYQIILLGLLFSFPAISSVIGISTHPLNEEARVLSAEMTGYMSQRNEMGMGLRYTQDISQFQRMDVSMAGGQDSRALVSNIGMDMELLSEDVSQPRVSVKPFIQYMKFEGESDTVLGAAPTLRKGFSTNGYEFFPYLALPTGLNFNNQNNEFSYYSSLTFGGSMPFPGANTNKLLFSLEGNMNMGSSSDYVGCLVSWVWN